MGRARPRFRLHRLGRQRSQLQLGCSRRRDASPPPSRSAETNGKSIGARFRIYPLPVDTRWGRLELGASTSMASGVTATGSTRGASISTASSATWQDTAANGCTLYRQMPMDRPPTNRQGWYVQAGYFLTGVKVPGLPDVINNYLRRFEPLVPVLGVNQRGVSTDDIQGATGVGLGGTQVGLVPDFGINGSPATYAPHSREVALALDYWIAPSIVWQNEVDIECRARAESSSPPPARKRRRVRSRTIMRFSANSRSGSKGSHDHEKIFAAILLATLAIGWTGVRVRRRSRAIFPRLSTNACSG